MERVLTIGPMKSKGLLGFHEFSGSDWGGKTVGITKKNMADAYLNSDDNSEVVKAFNRLGKLMNDMIYIYMILIFFQFKYPDFLFKYPVTL